MSTMSGEFLLKVVAGIYRNREQKIDKFSRQFVLLNMLHQLQESVLCQIGGKRRISIAATNTKLIDILIVFPHQRFKGFEISILYAPYQNRIFYVHHLLSTVKDFTHIVTT